MEKYGWKNAAKKHGLIARYGLIMAHCYSPVLAGKLRCVKRRSRQRRQRRQCCSPHQRFRLFRGIRATRHE